MTHRQRSVTPSPPVDKNCVACGRRIEWRAKWARDWNAVRYCSDACRRQGVRESDRMLEAVILEMLSQRAASAFILASDAAHAVGGDDWQELAEPARRAARRLVAAGEVEIIQGGSVVDPSTVKGPMRIRRRPRL